VVVLGKHTINRNLVYNKVQFLLEGDSMTTQVINHHTPLRIAEAEPVFAAEHDAWFKSQVQQAMHDADQPDAVFIPHDVVMDRIKARLDKLATQSK
jgi:hypothetical protein